MVTLLNSVGCGHGRGPRWAAQRGRQSLVTVNWEHEVLTPGTEAEHLPDRRPCQESSPAKLTPHAAKEAPDFTDLQTCSLAKVNKASNGNSAPDSGASQSPAVGQRGRQGACQVQGRQTSTLRPPGGKEALTLQV